MKIKVLGISASPRHGNTEVLVREALLTAEKEGAETEFISFVGKGIKPCIACRKCRVNEEACIFQDDWDEINKKFRDSDGVIIGSPVYFGGVTAQLKSYMDRCYACMQAKAGKDKTVVGGAIAVAGGRHGGQEDTLHQIRVFFQKQGMLPIGIRRPHKQLGATGHASFGRDIKKDEWVSPQNGLMTSSLEGARDLGRRVVLMTKIVKAGMQATGIDLAELVY